MNLSGLYFDLKLDNVSELAVVNFRLTEALNTLTTLTVHFASHNAQLPIETLILSRATLTIYRNGQCQRCFSGVIASIKKGKTGFHRTFYTIEVRPSLWLLTQRHTSRLFHQQSIPMILSQLMDEYQLTYQCRLDDNHEIKKMVMQRREFDFDFFDRLAAEEGLVYWFETDDDGKEICHLTDTYLGFKRGRRLQLTYQENQQNIPLENVMYDLSYEMNMTPQVYSAKDRKYRYPNTYHQHRTAGEHTDHIASRFDYYDGNPLMPNPEDSDTIAAYRLEALQNKSIIGQGRCNYIRIQPGKCFRLSNHPDPQLNQRWQPVKVTHYGQLPQSLQEDARGEECAAYIETDIQFMPDNRTWRPLAKPKPTAEGPESAIVIGAQGEEIHTNEWGEVQVQYHWDREKKATCWVRVAQDWSGDTFGFYAIPRVGQEVIISYLEGDLDQPIIIGSVYHGADRHPLQLPAEKTHTIIKTKTYQGQGFNELRFVDEPQQERIAIHAQKNMDTQILHDESVNITHDSRHHIHHDKHVRVDHEYRLHVNNRTSISTDHQLHIEAAQGVFAQGQQEVHIQSGAKVVIDAGSELTIQAAGHFIKIDASGISTSQILKVGAGCPGVGQGYAGHLPDFLDNKTGISAAKSLVAPPPVQTAGSLCLTCLMQAAEAGLPMVVRGAVA